MEDQFALNKQDFQIEKRKKVMKPLLWFGMVSIVMLFAGLTSAVIVRKGDGEWLHFEMPNMFLISCFVVVASSLFLILANSFGKKNNGKMLNVMLGLALLSGLAFVFTQLSGYGQLVDQGIFMTGATHNASGSFLYIYRAFICFIYWAV